LPHGGTFRGKAEVGRFFEGIGSAWDALDLEVEHVGAVGDEAVVGVVHADGTRKNGTSQGYGAVHVFDIRAGAIRRFHEYTDLDGGLA
jgi:ketosteroid isomerase-like protein